MNDYKELIEWIRIINTTGFEPKIENAKAALTEAADAIEQLVRERDAAVADILRLIVHHNGVCENCKNRFGDDPTCCLECDDINPFGNFEWRGVE